MGNVKRFLVNLLYENGEPSLTRIMAIGSYVAFFIATAYLILKDIGWAHYETFATLTAGGGFGTQVANKIINFTKGSPSGEPFIKNNYDGNKEP